MVNTYGYEGVTMIIANMHFTAWKPWMPRLAAFAVALLLAASLVFWILRWPAADSGQSVPLPAASEELPVPPPGAMARLLGADAAAVVAVAAPDAASRFRLTGIIASVQGGGQGVALLSIDGLPAKPYRVGSLLEDGWMLQSVQPRRVALAADADAPVRLELELPLQK